MLIVPLNSFKYMGSVIQLMSSTRYGKGRQHTKNLAQTYLSYSKAFLSASLGATAIIFGALLIVSQLDVATEYLNVPLATDILVVATVFLFVVDVVFAASTAFLFLLSRLER